MYPVGVEREGSLSALAPYLGRVIPAVPPTTYIICALDVINSLVLAKL